MQELSPSAIKINAMIKAAIADEKNLRGTRIKHDANR